MPSQIVFICASTCIVPNHIVLICAQLDCHFFCADYADEDHNDNDADEDYDYDDGYYDYADHADD